MQDLSLMTWKEAAAIDKDKSILFVTVAPIEEYGVHLPLATDLIEVSHADPEHRIAGEKAVRSVNRKYFRRKEVSE